MPTNTAGSTARNLTVQAVHYLRRGLTYADGAGPHKIGTVPKGALIHKAMSGVHVTTVSNAGTNKQIDVGTLATADLFGTDLSVGTATFVPLDEAIGGYLVAADTDIYVTQDLTGTGNSQGAWEVIICFLPDNDR